MLWQAGGYGTFNPWGGERSAEDFFCAQSSPPKWAEPWEGQWVNVCGSDPPGPKNPLLCRAIAQPPALKGLEALGWKNRLLWAGTPPHRTRYPSRVSNEKSGQMDYQRFAFGVASPQVNLPLFCRCCLRLFGMHGHSWTFGRQRGQGGGVEREGGGARVWQR